VNFTLFLAVALGISTDCPDHNHEIRASIEASFDAGETLVLVGDSHAGTLKAAALEFVSSPGKLIQLTGPDCPPLFNVHKVVSQKDGAWSETKCRLNKPTWRQVLTEHPDAPAVVASRWELLHADSAPGAARRRQDWLEPLEAQNAERSIQTNLRLLAEDLDQTLTDLGDRPVILFGSVPTQHQQSLECAEQEIQSGHQSDLEINLRCGALQASTAEQRYHTVNQLLEGLASTYSNVIYIDPQIPLCPT